MCDLFCIRSRRDDDGDLYGSDFPEPQCIVHWTSKYHWFRDEYGRARRKYANQMTMLRRLADV